MVHMILNEKVISLSCCGDIDTVLFFPSSF